MDFTRQAEKFNRDQFPREVHIIGCGATGSWVALALSKLGVKKIHLYDFDEIEEHNLPNQFFSNKQVEKNKAEALKENCELFSFSDSVEIYAHNKKVEKKDAEKLKGIVFILTDTMASRKEISESLKMKQNIDLVVETRMGLEHGRVYSYNPKSICHTKRYSSTLYSDEEADQSACGSSQSIAPTAMMIASKAVWELIKYHMIYDTGKLKPGDVFNEIMFDVQSHTEMAMIW